MNNNRNDIFSMMKGVAIIAVVIGHCSIPCVERFVNQFHLATFYFVAGYFFKYSYVYTPWNYVIKRIKRLYIPFICYGGAFLLLHNLFCRLGLYSIDSVYSIQKTIHQAVYMTVRFSSNELFMGAMWFLSSLFFVSLLFLLLAKISSYSKKYQNIILCGLVLVTCLLGYAFLRLKFPNPYCIYYDMMRLLIFYMGYVFKQYRIFERYVNKWIAFMALALLFIPYLLGGGVYLQSPHQSNIFLFFIVPVVGPIVIWYICKLLNNSKLIRGGLALCGIYSFEIMALHFLSFKLVTLLQIIVSGGQWSNLSDFPVYKEDLLWWSPLYTIVGVGLPILLTLAYNRFKMSFSK